jgi:hypothetical protein
LFAEEYVTQFGLIQGFSWGFRSQACPQVEGNICSDHGVCIDGGCFCRAEWQGEFCENPVCSQPCVHGFCSAPGKCECAYGYGGEECDTPTSCPEPSPVANAQINCNGRNIHDVCFYECISGTHVAGTDDVSLVTRVCLASGDWSDHVPSCIIQGKCVEAPKIQNANFTCAGNDVGDSCVVECAYGYKKVISRTLLRSYSNVTTTHNDTAKIEVSGWEISCGEQGWIGERDATCQRVRCGPAPTPYLTVGACKSGKFGDQCAFVCVPGTVQVGDLSQVCQADGSWSKLSGMCVIES